MNSDNQSFSRTLQSGLPESSSYTLHVLEDDKNLSIKVHKIELTELPQQEREKLINLYCLFEYGDRQFNTDGGGDQSIDQSFETELEDEPQVLILSLFNKEIHAFKDRLVGTGSKEIVTTGRIEVPIYRDSEKTESVGRVLLDVRYK